MWCDQNKKKQNIQTLLTSTPPTACKPTLIIPYLPWFLWIRKLGMAWAVPTQSLSWGFGLMMSTRAVVLWRLDWCWRTCFQSHSLTLRVSQSWLLMDGPSFSPSGSLYSIIWVSSQPGGWLPPASTETVIQGSKNEAEMPWGSHTFSSAVFCWSPRSAMILHGRRTTKGYEY